MIFLSALTAPGLAAFSVFFTSSQSGMTNLTYMITSQIRSKRENVPKHYTFWGALQISSARLPIQPSISSLETSSLKLVLMTFGELSTNDPTNAARIYNEGLTIHFMKKSPNDVSPGPPDSDSNQLGE
ncbi:exported hypothetical protein [Agrobacterium deltaense NCPPB 1641]|uniref:Uncharacterized protein n=1 Tax=Agrobacterium deltaense NCPPB 1641 TaxID=1183425 RepID=A0A1S7UAF9_9HYPH|nr:exported hypothetical protein [Agrobacterium deltaense NCPPB 1641]